MTVNGTGERCGLCRYRSHVSNADRCGSVRSEEYLNPRADDDPACSRFVSGNAAGPASKAVEAHPESPLMWYALRTSPQREDMVKKLLIWRGLKAFIKTEKRARRKSKRDIRRQARTFCAAPSYVFVGIDLSKDDPWKLVHNCHLIHSVVSLNGLPAQLDPAKLADFLGFDDFDVPDYFMYFRTKGDQFAIGDQVRIDMPSLEGFTLPVKDIQNGEAIFELVLFQSQTTELRVPLDQVYKAA